MTRKIERLFCDNDELVNIILEKLIDKVNEISRCVNNITKLYEEKSSDEEDSNGPDEINEINEMVEELSELVKQIKVL